MLAGIPGHARLVGYALHALPSGLDIPWHRVLNSRGFISLGGDAGTEQQRLLGREGIRVSSGRIDLALYGWPGRSRVTGGIDV
jgi:methylated-DNA-protein-cysteine methyltransferase-like protein